MSRLSLNGNGWGSIGAAAGWGGDIAVVAADELPSEQQVDWRYHLWTDTRRIRCQLGYVQPVEIQDAVRRTVEWKCARG